jgi:hypothetical protein
MLSTKVGKQPLVLLNAFSLLFDLCYTLRPEASRTAIMMTAMISSIHMNVPRLKKTKPRSHSTTSIAATTKSKSSNPIFKSLTYTKPGTFYLKICDSSAR